MVKLVDEYFFDHSSKKMYYILGAAYASYAPPLHYKDMVLFRDSNKELIEIIRRELTSDHEIILDNRGKRSYFFGFTSQYIRSRLEELGLVQDKAERLFPKDIKDEYLKHFVRGFFDVQGHIYISYDRLNTIRFNFYKNFLEGLSKSLSNHAHIKEADLYKTFGRQYSIIYGHNASLKIHDFIYDDFAYIKENGLFLHSKKDLFKLDYLAKQGIRKGDHHKKTLEKIEEAKKLILEFDKTRDRFKEVATKIGYNSYRGFLQTFKSVVGLTPREFIKSSKQ